MNALSREHRRLPVSVDGVAGAGVFMISAPL
jgi:hypothetical protein